MTEPQRQRQRAVTLLKLFACGPELGPGLPGLALMIKPRHIGPGVDHQAVIAEIFQQASVTHLGRGSQVAPTDEINLADGP